jgi:DNA-binding NarL/FixJ family response regulator
MSETTHGRDIVLVVDDSPETLSFLTEALERSGATVLVATSGARALTLVERITPDTHVPVIFMTGLSETEHVLEGLEAGGVDYVTKPIVLDVLLARIRVHLANARTAQSARLALDTAGRYLLAANREGEIRWCTPQAVKLLESTLPSLDGHIRLPESIRVWLRVSAGERGGTSQPGPIPVEGGRQLQLAFLGKTGEDEFLFRLSSEDDSGQEALLRRHFTVTQREAEVLLWIARGKSNRDIAEILGLSPRTVNKHLEQVYQKLGVENRASAAVTALAALGER